MSLFEIGPLSAHIALGAKSAFACNGGSSSTRRRRLAAMRPKEARDPAASWPQATGEQLSQRLHKRTAEGVTVGPWLCVSKRGIRFSIFPIVFSQPRPAPPMTQFHSNRVSG